MSRQSIALFCVAALSSMSLALAFTPRAATATSDEAEATPALPQLTAAGCTVTLAMHMTEATEDNPARPYAEIQVTNDTDAEASFDCQVRMFFNPKVQPMSRMIPMPRMQWQKPVPIAIAPGESKLVKLTPDVAVPEGTTCFVRLQVDGEGGNARTISTSPSNGLVLINAQQIQQAQNDQLRQVQMNGTANSQ